MRAPAFWWTPAPNALAILLSPLGAAYGAATAHRMSRMGTRVGAPVICVGNFVAGGAGKTPTAIALAHALRSLGETPFFLTRGYGAQQPVATPLRVDPGQHDFRRVGDEPLLLARAAPTIVSPDRIAGARLAIAQGASVLVMDDGLQNPQLHKDFSIAVVDAAAGVGNGLCVPAGPLRAPLAAQTPFVDAALSIGEPRTRLALPGELRTVAGRLEPDAASIAALAGARVFAFAGIGRPEKFFDTLRAAGAIVVGMQAFADHHPFSATELAGLVEQARRHDAQLVTTDKDLVRLPGAADIAAKVATLPVRLVTDPADAMAQLAKAALAKARATG